jgi:hypothetical protein
MATPFSFESVADNVAPGGETCLALDRAGNPSVAFSIVDQAGSSLRAGTVARGLTRTYRTLPWEGERAHASRSTHKAILTSPFRISAHRT